MRTAHPTYRFLPSFPRSHDLRGNVSLDAPEYLFGRGALMIENIYKQKTMIKGLQRLIGFNPGNRCHKPAHDV